MGEAYYIGHLPKIFVDVPYKQTVIEYVPVVVKEPVVIEKEVIVKEPMIIEKEVIVKEPVIIEKVVVVKEYVERCAYQGPAQQPYELWVGTAPWCGPCKVFKSKFGYGNSKIKLVYVPYEEFPYLPETIPMVFDPKTKLHLKGELVQSMDHLQRAFKIK